MRITANPGTQTARACLARLKALHWPDAIATAQTATAAANDVPTRLRLCDHPRFFDRSSDGVAGRAIFGRLQAVLGTTSHSGLKQVFAQVPSCGSLLRIKSAASCNHVK